MASQIPTAASVVESAVIDAPLSKVWHLIKLQDFGKFWSMLDKSEWVKGASPDTDVVKWTFKDGTVLEVKQEEHSVGQASHNRGDTEGLTRNRPSTTTSPTRSYRPRPSCRTRRS